MDEQNPTLTLREAAKTYVDARADLKSGKRYSSIAEWDAFLRAFRNAAPPENHGANGYDFDGFDRARYLWCAAGCVAYGCCTDEDVAHLRQAIYGNAHAVTP